MRPKEDPCRDPASEARDDWADAPYEASCLKLDPATGDFIGKLCRSEEETREFFSPNNPTCCCEWCGLGAQELEDGNWLSRLNAGEVPSRWRCQTCGPNNLEGPGPTDEERRANAKAISKLTVPERFALMFRGAQSTATDNTP